MVALGGGGGGGSPPGGFFFSERGGGREDPAPRPAVIRRDQDRQPPAIRQRPNEVIWIALLGVDLAPVRLGKFRTNGAHAIAVQLLLGAQAEVHQACASRRIARARLTIASSTIWPSRV